jgi:hypothetical protein
MVQSLSATVTVMEDIIMEDITFSTRRRELREENDFCQVRYLK